MKKIFAHTRYNVLFTLKSIVFVLSGLTGTIFLFLDENGELHPFESIEKYKP